MKTPQPKRPTTKPRIPQSVKPQGNTKKIEDLEERRLLLQVIAEARAFCRPAMRQKRQEQQHGEK